MRHGRFVVDRPASPPASAGRLIGISPVGWCVLATVSDVFTVASSAGRHGESTRGLDRAASADADPAMFSEAGQTSTAYIRPPRAREFHHSNARDGNSRC